MKNLTVFSLLVVFLFCGLSVNSQQVVTRASTKIELIKRRIKKSRNDTVKIKLLQQWSDLVFITDPQKDLELQQQVIDICIEHLKNEKIPYLQKWFKEQESMALDKTATSYYYEGEDKKALKFYTASSKILEDLASENLLSTENTYLLSNTCNKIARMYEGEGNFKNALNYYQKSMRLESEVQAQRNKEQSLQHLSDSILLVSSDIMHQKEINYQKEVTKKKEKNLFFISCSLFVFLILFVLVLRSWKKTKSQNKIIENQKNDIFSQKSKLEESHKEITDSINYAKNIQDALMTSKEYINEAIPESFVFFLPKDVVSGDYYWVYKYSKDEVFFTVADCTGHGVPGAFMSMIGTSLLNENIVDYKIGDPSEVLANMRNKIIESLNDHASKTNNKDGMDMALCKLNLKTRVLEYSGANNPLIHISGEELNYVKGNSQPVGLSVIDNKPFTNHKLKLKKGDMIYIYSDGYQDQFGGPKGKKYMVKRFKTFLKEMSKLTIDEQRVKVQEEFHDWKGKHDQVDDICVMGIRV
jgi:serine phosphatase RsbU (regulator of sigma subunit)